MLICALSMLAALNGRTDTSAQSTPATSTSQGVVVLTKLSDPVYPQMTRIAHIWGDVELMLAVRQDGSIESAVVVSGPPMLQKAALVSAQQSLFECRGCGEKPTPYRLVYTFQLIDAGCCAGDSSKAKTTDTGPSPTYPQITQSQNRVSIVDEAGCFCDPAGQIGKVRSLKCLYLWRCAIHKW